MLSSPYCCLTPLAVDDKNAFAGIHVVDESACPWFSALLLLQVEGEEGHEAALLCHIYFPFLDVATSQSLRSFFAAGVLSTYSISLTTFPAT